MNLKATTIAISSLFVCTTLWAGEFASQTIRLAHTAAVSHAHHEAGVSGFLCLGRLFQGQPNEAALCI